MSNLAKTIWFGYYQKGNEQQSLPWLQLLIWTVFIASLFTLRLYLPFSETTAGMIHSRIVDSLLAGQDWGRQALAGSLKFPPLPALALFLSRSIASLLPVTGLTLMVTIAQIWSLCFFLRIPQRGTARLAAGLVVILATVLNNQARQVIFSADPAWINIVPLACITYHTFAWRNTDSLRELVIIGSASAVTVFAGPVCFLAGLLYCLGISIRVSCLKHHRHPHYVQGAHLLLWAPLLYAIALLFLGNWLILNDPLFFLRPLLASLAAANWRDLLVTAGQGVLKMPFLTLAAVLTTFISMRKRLLPPASILLIVILSVMLTQQLLFHIKFYSPAAATLVIALSISTFTLPFTKEIFTSGKIKLLISLVIIASALSAGTIRQERDPLPRLPLAMPNAPSPDMVAEAVDRITPESRIFVHGVRAAAIYPDLEEERFIRRLDFKEEHLLWSSKRERHLYFLLPPANGYFYPQSRSDTRTDIYFHGRDWLFLEKVWPGGWQLWRIL